jgi:putative nucleotidyltransferase with HDIG domain
MNPLLDTITCLAYAVEAKDPHTEGHSQAVSRLAAQIARQMRLSEADIEEIRLAGIVHDIGKIHVPESLLYKPAPLTAQEYEIMKTHAALGAKILEPLNQPGIERIVRYHHERYDGTGYPEGLAGDKIPLGARIMAVAESFENMVSAVSYNSARTFEEALAEMRRCSGTQFDPKVVTAFLDWLAIHGGPRQQP